MMLFRKNYDKGMHLEWWNELSAVNKWYYQKTYKVKQITNKNIFKMWKYFIRENKI